MSQLKFPCSGCRATLAIAAELAGKLVACPQCKARTTVPSPYEVVDDPPKQLVQKPAPKPAPQPAPPPRKIVKAEIEEAEEERLRFPCSLCGAKLAVLASKAGQTIECPKCGDRCLVPDAQEEVGTYGLEGRSNKKSAPKAKSPPVAAWWPDGKRPGVPATWSADLARARQYAERQEWKQALAVLNNLRKRGRENDIEEAHLLRKPLAYCLGRWALDELERLDAGSELSKPMRKLLKRARELQMWAGSFDSDTCPLCDRKHRQLIGTTQVRTTAGFAYLCCAAPTSADEALLLEIRKVDRKLIVAAELDAETPEVGNAMTQIPAWYRAVDQSASWWARTVTAGSLDGCSTGGGGLLGNMLGNALGDALGEAMGDLLS